MCLQATHSELLSYCWYKIGLGQKIREQGFNLVPKQMRATRVNKAGDRHRQEKRFVRYWVQDFSEPCRGERLRKCVPASAILFQWCYNTQTTGA